MNFEVELTVWFPPEQSMNEEILPTYGLMSNEESISRICDFTAQSVKCFDLVGLLKTLEKALI
jgi:hypothetical protein